MSNFYQDRTDIIHLREVVAIPLSRSLTWSYTLHILWTSFALLFPKHEWSNQYVLLVCFYLLTLCMSRKRVRTFKSW